jgi:hypothetical protein
MTVERLCAFLTKFQTENNMINSEVMVTVTGIRRRYPFAT